MVSQKITNLLDYNKVLDFKQKSGILLMIEIMDSMVAKEMKKSTQSKLTQKF